MKTRNSQRTFPLSVLSIPSRDLLRKWQNARRCEWRKANWPVHSPRPHGHGNGVLGISGGSVTCSKTKPRSESPKVFYLIFKVPLYVNIASQIRKIVS